MADPPPHPGAPYFDRLAEHLGRAYLRYDFTKGTEQEVGFLLELLALPAGARVLDVGCGPGRHAVELARAGLAVTGVDISGSFLALAAESARAAGVATAFFEVDARVMPFDDEFDAVISLCQGGFGLMGADDALVLRRMAEAARPGALVVLSAFNSYFSVAHPPESATLDADTGILYEVASLRGEGGEDRVMGMWTSVYTPRELRLLALGVGLTPEAVWGVEPGSYGRRAPSVDLPEHLLVARKP